MKKLIIALSIIASVLTGFAQQTAEQNKQLPTYEQYIKTMHPTKTEIDGFINSPVNWAKFDPELGYTLGNSLPHEGINSSSTISTSQPNGTRTSFMYTNRPCRINAYGDSFTQCQQVSDGETWEEYLAAHLGEPIRNFGMGGYGVYEAYRRMLLEEQTKDSAQYIIFYIWGDDHTRSLYRTRCMAFREFLEWEYKTDGMGYMFEGNFWPNLEIDLNTGKFVEYNSRITQQKDLYKMTDPVWMWENLKTDMALQMGLFIDGKIGDVDVQKLKQLSKVLNFPVDLDNPATLKENVRKLWLEYGFSATEYTLAKTKDFAEKHGKKLLVVIFDPYNVVFPILNGNATIETRYDKEIVDYLQENDFNYFDMNLVHLKDFKRFNLSVKEYSEQYFIGHYNPTGNHFFAMSIAPKIVEWLDPKPITYQKTDQKLIGFEGYLDMKSLEKK